MTAIEQSLARLAPLADEQARELLAGLARSIGNGKPDAKACQAFAEVCERAATLGLRNRNGRVTSAEVREAIGHAEQGAQAPAGGKPAKPARKRK